LAVFRFDDQLEFGGQDDRQIGGLFAFEYSPEVDTGMTIRISADHELLACRLPPRLVTSFTAAPQRD